MKKESKVVLIIAGLIVVLAYFNPATFREFATVTTPFETLGERIVYEDWQVNNFVCVKGVCDSPTSKVSLDVSQGGMMAVKDGVLEVSTAHREAEVVLKRDFRGDNVFFDMDFVFSGSRSGGALPSGKITLFVSNVVVFKEAFTVDGAERRKYSVSIMSSFLDESKANVAVNGNVVKGVAFSGDERSNIKVVISQDQPLVNAEARLILHSIKYSIPFGCLIKEDETVLKGEFVEKTYTIDDLQPFPERFCPESLPPRRLQFTEQRGVSSEIRGELLRQLASGKSVTVPMGSVDEVFYIGKYNSSIMKERCPRVGQYYHAPSGKCVSTAVELQPVREVIRDTTFIFVGTGEARFTNDVSIGDFAISSTPANFVCREDVDTVTHAPLPANYCWETVLSYGGRMVGLNAGERTVLDAYHDIVFHPNARFIPNEGVMFNANEFVLIRKKPFLRIIPVVEDTPLSYFELLSSPQGKIQFKIQNDLTKLNAKLHIVKTYKLTGERVIEVKDVVLNKGDNSMVLPRDRSVRGVVLYEINVKYPVGETTYFGDSPLLYNYEVVNEVPTIEKVIFKNVSIPVPISCRTDIDCGVVAEGASCKSTSQGVDICFRETSNFTIITEKEIVEVPILAKCSDFADICGEAQKCDDSRGYAICVEKTAVTTDTKLITAIGVVAAVFLAVIVFMLRRKR